MPPETPGTTPAPEVQPVRVEVSFPPGSLRPSEPASAANVAPMPAPTPADDPGAADAPAEPTDLGPAHGEGSVEVEGDGGPTTDLPSHIADPARRRAILPWLVAVAVVSLVGLIAFGLTFTPLFRADVIHVGGRRTSARRRS